MNSFPDQFFMEEHYDIRSQKLIDEALFPAGDENQYHPIRDYMLCPVGVQGAGKSGFFRFLAIRASWHLDPDAAFNASYDQVPFSSGDCCGFRIETKDGIVRLLLMKTENLLRFLFLKYPRKREKAEWEAGEKRYELRSQRRLEGF